MISKTVEQLKSIIATDLDLNLKVDDIDENISLFEDGIGLDSIILMEFITLIESRCNFQFSDDELNLEPFGNLTVLAEFIDSKQGHA